MGVVAILCAGLVLVQGAFSQVDEDTQEQGRQGHQDVIPSVPPVLNKCCPSGQTFDMSSSFSCIPEPQEKHVYSYRETLEPVFLSQKLSERDFFPDAPPFNLRVSGLPRCDPEAGQELTYLINPDNDIEFSNFAVDDEGITGKQYSLFNLDESDIVRRGLMFIYGLLACGYAAFTSFAPFSSTRATAWRRATLETSSRAPWPCTAGRGTRSRARRGPVSASAARSECELGRGGGGLKYTCTLNLDFEMLLCGHQFIIVQCVIRNQSHFYDKSPNLQYFGC